MKNRDVITLIEQDHREFERLFERLRTGDGDREMLFQQLSGMLAAHSRAEEAEVYPELARADKQEFKHARQEHAEADELVVKLKGLDADSPEFEETLLKLIEGVQHHIEEEESKALPELRRSVSADRLAQLAQAFVTRRGQELEKGPKPKQLGGSELSKEKLLEKAREHHIPGRSQMTKEELLEAVKTASG